MLGSVLEKNEKYKWWDDDCNIVLCYGDSVMNDIGI